MIADAFVSYIVDQTSFNTTHVLKYGSVDTAVSMVNSGNVRSGMSVGNITMKDVISAAPFGNVIGVLKVNGSQLWHILEHSASQHRMGGFLQVSGIRYTFDSNKPNGQRLRCVSIRHSNSLSDWEALDNHSSYSVVITEYLVNGGDNFTMINKEDYTPFEIYDYTVISTYVKMHSPINTRIENRIINSNVHENCGNGGQSRQTNLPINILFIIIAWSLFLIL